MIQSEKINDLLSELAEVQNELPTMPKSSQAYGYKYTDLDTITQTIKPILHNHGIGYIQSVGGLSMDDMTLTTRIFNKAGQYIEDTAALPAINSTKNNAAQTLGMSITYMRRYALCAMLGITSDEDVDANTDGRDNTASRPSNTRTPQPPKQAAKPKQPAKLPFTPKGGESTPEEKARIKELCEAKYADGKRIFSNEEIKTYSGYRQTKTARELIAFIENALRNRRGDAPELPPAEPAPPAQPSAEDLAEQALTEAQQPSFDTMQPVEDGESDANQAFDIF
jgi:hypothetical protein